MTRVATLEEIRANDYSLNPGRYVEIVEQESEKSDLQSQATIRQFLIVRKEGEED